MPCPGCQALIEADFATCPYCRRNLKANCATCGQALRLEWILCPYCNTSTTAEPKASTPAPVKVEVSVSMAEAVRAGSAEPAREPAPAPGPAVVVEPALPAEPAAIAGPALPAEPPAPEPPPAEWAGPVVRQEPPAPAPPGTHAEPGRRPLRALVVDDDPDIRLIVAATLRKMAIPIEVVQAQDGVEAIEKAREAPPDLAVLDVMMPRMDGFDTCRALRENVRTAFVPILMLTASADQDSRTKGYLIGTDDYMAKPFLPVDLKLRIARLLRKTYGI
jgi:CheY-like chemotaxis protein/RNA polymerase subunit RPABC4/transcription elongation factor Spt4